KSYLPYSNAPSQATGTPPSPRPMHVASLPPRAPPKIHNYLLANSNAPSHATVTITNPADIATPIAASSIFPRCSPTHGSTAASTRASQSPPTADRASQPPPPSPPLPPAFPTRVCSLPSFPLPVLPSSIPTPTILPPSSLSASLATGNSKIGSSSSPSSCTPSPFFSTLVSSVFSMSPAAPCPFSCPSTSPAADEAVAPMTEEAEPAAVALA
ncbi:unnamed protein product, partial [Closterium sp. NIES-53]